MCAMVILWFVRDDQIYFTFHHEFKNETTDETNIIRINCVCLVLNMWKEYAVGIDSRLKLEKH